MTNLTPAPKISYTVWSNGRLVGESDLGYVRCVPKHRMGWFHPTPVGDALMPLATGPQHFIVANAEVPEEEMEKELELAGGDFTKTSTFADIAAASTHQASLQLELRGPDGKVVPTEWVDIRDTQAWTEEQLDAYIEKVEREENLKGSQGFVSPGEDAEFDDDEFGEDCWESDDCDFDDGEATEFPRYQLQVMLLDDGAIP